MKSPAVSFVVPCYKFAHLLSECVDSILSQSFRDLEVLIMDDASPDNTADVAQSFQDPRVRYIRNERNLKALPNYNKGIGLSRGKYVWLISADDYLRRPFVLEQYVSLLESNPRVGYAFCPGVGVRNGRETGTIAHSAYGNRDRIVSGRTILKSLLPSRLVVLSPSAIVRRECYERLSMFPLDVTWAGDPINMVWGGEWYLWCLFALHFDVAYFAEPMVCYRQHELAVSSNLTDEAIKNCILADIAVPWMIKRKADELGLRQISRDCLDGIVAEYAQQLTGKWYSSGRPTITFEQFEDSLCRNTPSKKERDWIRARVQASRYYTMADQCRDGDLASAREFYRLALQHDPWIIKAYAKLALSAIGRPGLSILGELAHHRSRRFTRHD